MARYLPTLAVVVPFVAALAFAGCDRNDTRPATANASAASSPGPAPRPAAPQPSNTKRLRAGDLVDELAAADLDVERLGDPQIDMDDLSRFPEEPRSAIVLRLSDGRGNSEAMTFVEFGSWKTAAELDAKPVNGFAVRNWFVLGTVSNHFVDLVTDALDG